MTTMSAKMLVAAFTTATLAMGATTARADHYPRSCGGGYPGYTPVYYSPPVYAPTPVVYAGPSYGYGYTPYRPVTYVPQPVYYPRYYAPTPVYRPYYAQPSVSFGFGYGRGGYGGHVDYRGHGGHGHRGGGFSVRVGR